MLTESLQQSLRRLQQHNTDPLCCYVYDLQQLQAHATFVKQAMPDNCRFYYAIKANSDAPILKTLLPIVDGFEVASGGELAWLKEHCPKVHTLFGGPGKTLNDLSAAIEQDVLLHVESQLELERIEYLAAEANRTVDIMLRVNLPLREQFGTRLTMGGRPTPFGMQPAQIEEILVRLDEFSHVRLKGFHFHLMSHQQDVDRQIDLLGQYFDYVTTMLEQYQLSIDLINVGGGVGIHYIEPDKQFDWARFCERLLQLITSKRMTSYQILFELGRYVTAGCGFYAVEVIDIKENFGECFVVCRGGTHHFRTPYAQGHNHPFEVLETSIERFAGDREHCVYQRPVSLVGQLCTPKDIFAKQVHVDRIAVGDLVVFTYAGAYAWNISHHDFLRHPNPLFLYLSGTDGVELELIKNRPESSCSLDS